MVHQIKPPPRTVGFCGAGSLNDRPVDVLLVNKKLKQLCESERALQREHGQSCARKVSGRLQDLEAAPSLEDMRSLPGACHELTGDRAGQLAIRVGGGKRLILEPASNPTPVKEDGGLDWREVRAVRIVAIHDYHSG
jgi:plasmid maintenance system killer protein